MPAAVINEDLKFPDHFSFDLAAVKQVVADPKQS